MPGNVVSPTTPRDEDGIYWGYTTRMASSISAIFDECPFDGGYDLKVGKFVQTVLYRVFIP